MPNPNNRKIKELELDKTGKIHMANQEFLNLETYSIAQFDKASIDYWNGRMNNQANTEILYEGKFRVISEFNDLDQI